MNNYQALKSWNQHRYGLLGIVSNPVVCSCGKKTKFYAEGKEGTGKLCKRCYIAQQLGIKKEEVVCR